ncbi:MAG TPA: hypothetical protein V6D29_13710 [Leptolyngbyaceae cyanobacterium]
MAVVAVKVTGSDILSWNDLNDLGRTHSGQDYAAVPDSIEPLEAEEIYTKCGGSFIRVTCKKGETLEVRSFVNEDPRQAIQEALNDAATDGFSPDDLNWWQDIY